MNVEENRLRTFTNWPTNAAVGADRIAKAGFYYTGMGLEVQCFLCGTKIAEWNYGDQAIARHRQAAPDCPFVLHPSNTCNIPLLPPSITDGDISSSSSMGQAQSENVTENECLQTSQDSARKYRTMKQRLETFTNWQISDIVSPESLAKAGFYYLQKADLVVCAFCHGVIFKWERGDDPEREHRIQFPNCDFYMRQDNEDDIYEDLVELTNVKLKPGTATDLKNLGIQTHTAARTPKHATYEGRLRTFEGWPVEMMQTPEMLATAGFYYGGTGDLVRCFHCDGGLRNWEAMDDAWIEHARWFPKCGFVSIVRGPEFIKQCVDSRPPLDPAIAASVPEDDTEEISETPPASLSTVLSSSQGTTSAMGESMHIPPTMEALTIGKSLHMEGLKKALRKRIEETGVPYEDADQLIADVFREQTVDDGIRESETKECANTTKRNEIPDIEDKAVQKTNINSEVSASLVEENRRLKEARLCKICMDREVAVVFLPCGHLATCVHCAPSLRHCSMCRQEIRATVRTFLS